MSEARLTELEIRYTLQERLVEELNQALIEANAHIARLEKRLERLEGTLGELDARTALPPSEKPPHY